jgi:DNA-binding winged helix-turn-helix (wHTH) protein
MLTIREWLEKAGFRENPFGLKEAEKEGELLSGYFIEHPSFNEILDQNTPQSSILYASRGTGKSSALRMFTAHWDESPDPRPLFVYLTDWFNIVSQANEHGQITLRQHLDELLCQVVKALVEQPATHGPQLPSQDDTAEYLHWICSAYNRYITPLQQRRLVEWGYKVQPSDEAIAIYASEQFPVVQHMQLLSKMAQDMGYIACYVLIDKVDELAQTVADWEACARILEELVGNLPLHEVHGIAFKYFIPTEVFSVLDSWRKIRRDRIGCFNLSWNEQQIVRLLRNRLTAFSQNKITSLAPLASKDLRDIDERLGHEANGSPRNLLNLGDWLIQACAADATDKDITVYEKHFQIAQREYRAWLYTQQLPEENHHMPDTSLSIPDASSDSTKNTDRITYATIPPLCVLPDGRILRGETEIQGGDKLPKMQRTLLKYLYDNRDRYCDKDEIIAHVWKGKAEPVSDSSLRKLVDRLKKFIETDPFDPVYIKQLTGGGYRLENTLPKDERNT